MILNHALGWRSLLALDSRDHIHLRALTRNALFICATGARFIPHFESASAAGDSKDAREDLSAG